MRMRSLVHRAVTVLLGGLSVAACAASKLVAPPAGAAPDPAPRAPARSHEECVRATREAVARAVDGGACEDLDSPPSRVPATESFGIDARVDDFWCSDESGQCERGRAHCECLLGPTSCSASSEAHCFETRSCTDGRRKYALTCYRDAPRCEQARSIFGMPGATCHVFKASADAAATSARRSPYADCDPAKKNSDGTPKRAPAGPPGQPPETLVLSYDDFAPQASAFKLIGFEWWAWEGGGSWEQCDDFDIRVVVFRGISQKVVEKRYPSAKSKADLVERGLADYRYVEHKAALAHLDAELADIAGAPDLAQMAERLRATRRRIVDALGE